MLKRFFYGMIGFFLLCILGGALLWKVFQNRHITIPYCAGGSSYLIEIKRPSIGLGEKKLLRLSLLEVDVKKEENYCETSQESSTIGWVSWIFDWVEFHAQKVLLPQAQLDSTTLELSRNFDHAILVTTINLFDSFSKKPWVSIVKAQYQKGILEAQGIGSVNFKLRYEDTGTFRMEHFNIAKKDLWELQLLQTQGSLEKQKLSNLSGGVNLKILDSDIATLYYDYHPPKFTLLRGGEIIGEGYIQRDSIEAHGLVPLYDIDISFMGSSYSFKKVEWRSFSYDMSSQFGKANFTDIQMSGIVPLTIDKVDCEGDLLNGSGVCQIGKVSGPQGVTMEGFNIVISGFNDLAGTFQGTINPAQWLPVKIPFINTKDFFGSFMRQSDQNYLLLQPTDDASEELLKIGRVFYQQNGSGSTRVVFEASINGTPFFCHNNSDSEFQCLLGEGFDELGEHVEILRLRPDWKSSSFAIELPSSAQTWTDIRHVSMSFLDPTLWCIDAINSKGLPAGQMRMSFDEGVADLTELTGELWDIGFQGTFFFDEKRAELTAHYINMDLLYDVYQSFSHSGFNQLWLDGEHTLIPNELFCDVKHLQAVGYDFGKIHLSYISSNNDHERRWTLVHPSLRAQLIEKKDREENIGREAVVQIDNLAFLAPAVNQMAQVAKGQLIINYHQSSQEPQRHFFYASGSDVFLKNSACQELHILNVLSGYAFSPAQLQALLTDGWLIDKITAQGVVEKGRIFLKDSYVQSGATSFQAIGSYACAEDLLAIDLLIKPKISQALPSMGFALGPFAAGLTFAGVQLFGSEQLDKMNEHKWQLRGSLQAPEIKPWEAQVIDLRAIAGEDNGAKDVVVLEGGDLKKVIHQEDLQNKIAQEG